jgi:large conductance mechanosensitive channel
MAQKVRNSKVREELLRLESPFGGFMEFVREQGIIGLAIGVVIGVAVNGTVEAIVDGFINPLVGLILPADSKLEDATFTLLGSEFQWGNVLLSLINLLAVAFIIYFVVRRFKLHLAHKNDKE